MAANSFQVKGWSTAVVSALLALSLSKDDQVFANLALFPLLAFWALDGYYLALEKGFRGLYDRVRKLPESEIDYSMERTKGEQGLSRWLSAAFSFPNLFFHVSALVVAIVVSIYVYRPCNL